MSILKTENLVMRFGGVTAVNNLNIEVDEGKIIALIGPNGAGKTTVFNMVTGVYKPIEGKIYYENEELIGLRPDQVTKKGIARTFQNIRLFSGMSVLDNVFIGSHLRLKANVISNIFNLPNYKKQEKAHYEKALHLLEKFDLIDVKDDMATSLPYGKQRKLEIARAIATDPKLLLLDEPAAGMNPKETEELTDFIYKIRDDYKLSVFLIEHHMHLVMGISERIYVLDYGNTIAVGNPYDIQNNKKVIEAYLGVG